MRKPILVILATILVLILASLACGQYVAPSAPVSVTPTITTTKTLLSPTLTLTVPSSTPSGLETILATIVKPVVNVHTNPDGTVIGNLEAGTRVVILSCKDNWCQIQDPPGWIWQGCLSENPEKLGCEAK